MKLIKRNRINKKEENVVLFRDVGDIIGFSDSVLSTRSSVSRTAIEIRALLL